MQYSVEENEVAKQRKTTFVSKKMKKMSFIVSQHNGRIFYDINKIYYFFILM